jgi:hypothetical protein
LSFFSIRAAQDAQVIPPISSSTRPVATGSPTRVAWVLIAVSALPDQTLGPPVAAVVVL